MPFSERRFVIYAAVAPEGTCRRRAAPWVVLGAAGTSTATTTGGGDVATAATTAAGSEPATATAAAGLGDLRGGVAQRGTDFVDLELDDRALLTLAGFVGALLEPSTHDHAGATGQAFRDIFRSFAPDVAA